ncbi:Peptidase B [hydrothermal vent metagenome]|uniref:Peptidase B n=1 Tax=hydrothermal vent metagenome TaxID=652676 RepID=A0A3B0T0Q1_9ZZZZ
MHTVKEGGLDAADLPDSLKQLAADNGFNGEAGAVLANKDGVLLGLGDGRDPFIAAAAADKLPKGDYSFAAWLNEDEAPLACLGWLMGGYRFDRYKSQRPAVARLIAPSGVDIDAVLRAGAAIGLVRDLVNTPAADMTPETLEAEARAISNEYGGTINVVTGADLLEQGFPMIHAVGRAAAVAPRLIDLAWGDPDAPKLTLVGKGVTFDSGGLNMKGAAGMALMKKDMGGAAHALALGRMIMAAGLKLRLRVLVAAVENAVAGNAYRPGDVLASRKGLSVEIGNTDAEGRLVLADALALGGEEDPDLMISLATLTGAARVALGPELAPFYCDDDDLAAALQAASTKLADPVWRMPLWRNYDAMLSSQIADVNHISGGAFAGSITAALFLRRFTPAGGAWMHFDLYAWRAKAAPGRPVGGEAQAIRALFEVLAARYPA